MESSRSFSIVRIPLLAIPYIFASYYEMLFTPVRNIIFFVHLLAGVGVYLVAAALFSLGGLRGREPMTRLSFSLSMLGWALNEEDNIEGYIDRAGRFLETLTDDFELIVIDDGSTDRTWAIASELQRTRPWLRLYRNGRNRGGGYNTKRTIGLAQKDYLFWQTVDWAYDIDAFRAQLSLLNGANVLQGVRSGSLSLTQVFRVRSDNPYKGLVSACNYLLIRVLFRLPLSDYQNVTVYPRALIQSVTLESESSFTNPECQLKTWWKGVTFHEVHVPFIKRVKGVSTGTRPRAIVAAIADILRWWVRWIVLGRRADRGRGRVMRTMS